MSFYKKYLSPLTVILCILMVVVTSFAAYKYNPYTRKPDYYVDNAVASTGMYKVDYATVSNSIVDTAYSVKMNTSSMASLTAESGIDAVTILVDQSGVNKKYTFAHLANWTIGKLDTRYLQIDATGASLTAVNAITLQGHAASYFQVAGSYLTSIDIHGATAETSIADGDEVLIYDVSASANRKMTKANFVAGITGTGDMLAVNYPDLVAIEAATPSSGYLHYNGSGFVYDTPSGASHDAVTLSTDLGNNLLGLSTQQLTLDNQTNNYVFAGPATGGAGVPSFRALVAADIPSLTSTYQAYDADLTTWAGVTPGTGVATALGNAAGATGGVALFGGALGTPSFTAVNLPSSNADPGTTAGQIRHDSTITNLTHGGIKWYDGTNVRTVVDLDASLLVSGASNYFVRYNYSSGIFELAAGAAGQTVDVDLDSLSSNMTSGGIVQAKGNGNGYGAAPGMSINGAGILTVNGLNIAAGGTITCTPSATVQGAWIGYELSGNGTNKYSFTVPASITTDLNFVYIDGAPTGTQVMGWTNSSGTVTQSWVTPEAYSAILAGIAGASQSTGYLYWSGSAWAYQAGTGSFTGGTLSSDLVMGNGLNIKSDTTSAHTFKLQGYNSSSYVDLLTITNNATPYITLASSTVGTTQAADDNSTKLATTAYADSEFTITGSGFTAGRSYYIASNGTITEADATSTSTLPSPAVGVAISTTAIRTRGKWTTTGLTAGSRYWVPVGGGALTVTKPTGSGNQQQCMGVAISTTVLQIMTSIDVGNVQ
jgi:hypothetical protein